MEERGDAPGRMPLNAGHSGYGSVPGPGSGPGLSGSLGGASESAPLLIPDLPEQERGPCEPWRPLSKEELVEAAGGPGWRRARCYLVLLFWLAWLAMLATSIAIIWMSPRPQVTPLRWWQRTLFYQLQTDTHLQDAQERKGAGGLEALCEQLPYLRSLGIGGLILEGLFDQGTSPVNITGPGVRFKTLPQIQHLIAESNKAGLKVVLDFCKLHLSAPEEGAGDAGERSKVSATVLHALRFWLEQGVAGFAICDTDAAYSEKTLREWRGIFKEFSNQEDEERIVMVRQTQDSLPPLDGSGQSNVTLVDLVMKSILPSLNRPLTAEEVAAAIETHLTRRQDDIWPSWIVGGEASPDLKRLLLVLTMTLPGSPAVQYDEALDQTQNVSLKVSSSSSKEQTLDQTDKEKSRRSAVALFTSLSRSRAREEALLYGSFTFLPFNTSSNSSSSSNSTLPSAPSPPVLAFLRSWGCVHFLVLLNVGPHVHALEPAWAPSLPVAGVFVASTGMDRLGTTALDSLELQPQEAIVIKLFEGGSYS